MRKKHNQSTREVELSRKLATVLESLPYGYIMYMIQHFANQLNSNPEKEINYEISTEKMVNTTDRYDIYIPLTYNKKYNELIIETKLNKIGDVEIDQMERYLKNRKTDANPLIVGIGKGITKTSDDIVLIQWDQIFLLLLNMLGYDSKMRILQDIDLVTKYSNSTSFQINIGPALENVIENLLKDISQKGLLTIPIANRVLVVTGKFATESCRSYDIDLIGNRWDHSFKYLCVVYNKTLQYVGENRLLLDEIQIVEGKFKNRSEYDISSEERKNITKLFIENAKKSNVDEIRGSAVLLNPVDLTTDMMWNKYSINIGEQYQGTGAITQSHRYFNSPESFINNFRQDSLII